MSDRQSALTGATTYQAIVIALVAAGIISIGIMSVCYRRRRRERWETTVRAGLDRARYRHGFGDPLGPDGSGEDDLGEKPVLFDVDIGGEGDDWVPIRVGMDRDDIPTNKRPDSPPAQSHSQPQSQDTNVELTILVAMPQPPFQPDQTNPPRRTDSSSSLSSIDLKGDPDRPPRGDEFTFSDLPHYTPTSAELESEELPYMEVGTTVVPLSLGSSEEREMMQELRLGTMGSRAGIAGDWGRTETTGSGR